MVHRGPDGAGSWVAPSEAACLSHRRLSIIDIEGGSQPFLAEDSSAGLVFNGEIYNYLELRKVLEAEGVQFRTQSDTEVLFHLLRTRGEGALDELIGMFAFAFWDENRERLLLARDRVGKKPLFYAVTQGCLYFSSTLHSIRHAVYNREKIDLTSVYNFLNLSYIPAPATIFQGIYKLSAGSYLTAKRGDPGPTTTKFWTPVSEQHREPVSQGAAREEFEQLLLNAIRLRLRSDVPLGVFLSGGVDSSLVTALAAKECPSTIRTFTVGFREPGFDESDRARTVARYLGTEHHEFHFSPDLLGILPLMLRHFGEPFADSAALPLWHLSEQARPQITVALLGDGGDEGFAGYEWYRTADRLERIAQLASLPGISGGTFLLKRFGTNRLGRIGHLLNLDPGARFAQLRSLLAGPNEVIFTGSFLEGVSEDQAAPLRIAALFREQDLPSPLNMMYADLRTYLADGLLPKVDVCSMAHSLEARAPLLDHRILEFAYRLTGKFDSPGRSKQLLYDALDRHLPSSLIRGPKRGFTVPLRDWFRVELRREVESLASGNLMETGWFQHEALLQLVEEHMIGKRDNSDRLFNFIVLSTWLDLYA